MTVIAMSRTEIDRMHGLRDLAAGRITVNEAAQLTRLTRRHVFRLAKAYRERGPSALVSTRRGQPSNRRYHRPVSEHDQLDEAFAWKEDRTVSNSLTLQYDHVLFILEAERGHKAPRPPARHGVRLSRRSTCDQAQGPGASTRRSVLSATTRRNRRGHAGAGGLLRQCDLLSAAGWNARPFLVKLGENLARLVSPLL